MKKLILLLNLTLLCAGLNAQQQYQSVLNNGMARWSMIGGGTDIESFGIVVADNDTLISDVLYKKIYIEQCYPRVVFKNNADWQNYVPEFRREDEIRMHPYIFIRESEDASKMYIRYRDTWYDYNTGTWHDMDEEYLIFDLNLEVGDSFILTNFYGRPTTFVDSVYVKNGLKHVQLDWGVRSPAIGWESLTFIEGVGPNTGIMQSFYRDNHTVNCFQNEILFYKDDKLCDYHCGYQESFNKITKITIEDCIIQVETGNLIISCNEIQNVQVIIYDMFGQSCFNSNFSGQQQFLIPILDFSKGIYVLRVFDKNTKKVCTNKIIL